MTELSIGELDSLVLKAYRGSGFSWGLSQEAGRAAAWMAMHGLPAAKCFTELLQKTDGLERTALTPETNTGNWSNFTSLVCPAGNSGCCPVIAGTMLSDFGWTVGSKLRLSSVYSPLILIPFVSFCAKSARTALRVSIDEVSIYLTADGQLVSTSSECELVAPVARRAAISGDALERLEALAHRTYVPASDQSRSGAGAGLTDND